MNYIEDLSYCRRLRQENKVKVTSFIFNEERAKDMAERDNILFQVELLKINIHIVLE